MGIRYTLAVLALTAVFATGCSRGADNTRTSEGSGRYFDENGRRIAETEFDPTYGYGLDSDGNIINDGENFIDEAAREVREMGNDVKNAADDMTDGNTAHGTDVTKNGYGSYDSPEMSGVNGAGDYTGMAESSQTAMDY